MSQQADIAKHCLSLAIKKDFTLEECLENINGIFEALEYGESSICAEWELAEWIQSLILNQRDGLYGVSHYLTNDWLRRRLGK